MTLRCENCRRPYRENGTLRCPKCYLVGYRTTDTQEHDDPLRRADALERFEARAAESLPLFA